MTPKTLSWFSLGLLLSAPLFGVFGWAVTGFGGPEGSTRAGFYSAALVCGLALVVALVAVVAWVISVGVRGGQLAEND